MLQVAPLRLTFRLSLLLLLCCTAVCVSGTKREYYMTIEEIDWNYAPSGKNLIHNRTLQEDEEAAEFLLRGPQRIGSTYKKAVYKQYSDATYTTEVVKPPWLGFLGPLLMIEEGDTLVVHLKNKASRHYSLHPHGLNYSKGSEGALYPDGTGPELKFDDAVAPSTTVTYEWTLPVTHSPKQGDSNCLSRFYHSHLHTAKDIATGVIGPLVICRKGTIDLHGDSSGDYLYTLLFMVSDENQSWYIDDNIRTYITSPAKDLKEDEDFIESNKMHGINGYLYGNLVGLSMCQGSKIQWYLIGLGDEVDIHSVHFHGQILTTQNHHTDTISLLPASSALAEMVADNPGHWLLTCTINDHLSAGMQTTFEIKKCFPNVHKPRPHGELREFFIAAEEEVWDYAPTLPTDSEAETFVTRGSNRIGSRYKKARYIEYTDNTFLTKMLRTPQEQHLGILGPVLRAEEGDTIRVVFKNKASRPYSIQPHGVQYSIEQDGTPYYNEMEESYTAQKLRELKKQPKVVTIPPAAQVASGAMHTYEWVVPIDAGPVSGEADCLTYMYYSGVDAVKDTNSGLVGPLLICRPNTLKKGIQKNYAKEYHLLAAVFDENLSWYLDDNIKTFTTAPTTVNKEDDGFMESNQMHAINGFVYRNLPGLTMCKGDKVTWHLSGLGTELNIHSLHFQGNRFIYRQNRRDAITLTSHISHTVTMEPDSMGQFEVVSATVNDYRGGMRANYTVDKCSIFHRQGVTTFHSKTYYIAAMEIEWDYAPNRTWVNDVKHGQDSTAQNFLSKEGGLIGSSYKKVVYRQFTNDKFTEQVERTADKEHLGIMGPIIHAKVDGTVEIVFKNMASRPYSIHAYGVKTASTDVYHTPPGKTHTYTWYATNAGPTTEQEECSVSAYYSTVDVSKDLYSGLIGPLVICRGSWARTLGLKKEVEEFALLFVVFDENESWYLDENIRTHVRNPRTNLKEDETFIESNKMHSINGYLYNNLEGLNMEVGDKVYWYLMGMGTDVDLHSVHWHGHSVEYKLGGSPHDTDVYELFPATFQTVKMRPQYPGTWLLHCHVNEHMVDGMITTYTVTEKGKKKLFG
ncbi:ceruloplasmin [Thalassophryne amazonica]|uniref:ceruloplasmin n=1 Tax=Thalassophryne amazonica TaxID=390379 RepID=UPI001471B5B8|nr:ceruloplasmin [Thalassophryne amazonica]